MIRRILFGKKLKQTTKDILKEKVVTLALAAAVYGVMYLYEERKRRKTEEKIEE